MNEKERMQKNIVDGIITAFNKLRVSIGDKCAYTSYLTKELLQKKYGINAELKAGELIFNPMILPLVYRWDPPYEFHMWVKLDDEIIDIAPVGLTQRQEFEDGGVYFKYRDVCIPVVWEKIHTMVVVIVKWKMALSKLNHQLMKIYIKSFISVRVIL